MRYLFLFMVALSLSLGTNQSSATSVLQMNLSELSGQSEKIFRGTLVDVKSSKVSVGGGELSTLIYTFKVSDVFKGEAETQKGEQIIRFEMLGTMKKHLEGERAFIGMPIFSPGETYLVMVAAAGDAGITAPMGLGQGAFRIYQKGAEELAVNEFGNLNLEQPKIVGGAVSSAFNTRDEKSAGPIAYQELATQIKTLVNQ